MPRYSERVYNRHNPSPVRGRPESVQGRQQDQQTGQWTYSGYIVADDFGTLVDARGDGYDIWKPTSLSSMDDQNVDIFVPGGRD